MAVFVSFSPCFRILPVLEDGYWSSPDPELHGLMLQIICLLAKILEQIPLIVNVLITFLKDHWIHYIFSIFKDRCDERSKINWYCICYQSKTVLGCFGPNNLSIINGLMIKFVKSNLHIIHFSYCNHLKRKTYSQNHSSLIWLQLSVTISHHIITCKIMIDLREKILRKAPYWTWENIWGFRLRFSLKPILGFPLKIFP